MMDNNTQYFKVNNEPEENEVKKTLIDVYGSLLEKGYNPINQLVGYILSGDPTYITSNNNARSKISKINRDELLEELIRTFVCHNELKKK